MANRYTKLSTSTFDPMSFQEQLFLPKYMREQHDSQNVAMSELDSGIAKSDPLGVHSDIASKEQQRLYEQITTQRDKLANEGFTQNAKNELLRLNKEYQSSISPTGVLGKANASKAAYTKNFQEYMKDATEKKKWSREQALTNWTKFEQNYTGFDSEGGISNIGQLGAPTKVNLMDKLKDVKSILGEQVVREIASGNFSFNRQDDGSLAIVNRSGRRIETSNTPNITSAMKMINSELSDPNSEWVKSIQFEGVNPENIASQITSGLGAMVKNKVSDTIKENISFKGVQNLNEATPTNKVPYSFESVESFKIQEESFLNKLKNISESKITPGGMESSNNINESNDYGVKVGKNIAPTVEANFSNDSELARFNSIKSKLIKQGVLNDDMPVTDQTKLMHKYLSQFKDVPYQNPIIEPNSVEGNLSSAFMLDTKDVNSTNRNIKNKISDGRMKIWDEKGNEIKLNDLPDGYNVEYTGYIGATNLLPTFKNATEEQSVVPHRIQIKDKSGKFIKLAYGSRNEYERNNPEFKAYSTIKKITNVGLSLPGLPEEFIVKSNDPLSKVLSKYESAYNPLNKTYTIKLYDKKGELKNSYVNMPQDKFQDLFHQMYKKLN
jgi:hypothetical protein